MLFKIAGGFILIIASSVVGFQVADGFTRRPSELRQLQSALQLLETEIGYGASPLPEAFLRISQFCEPPVKSIFLDTRSNLLGGRGLTAGEAWINAIRKIYGETALSEADRMILEAFGASLGASDREDQLKHLKLTREQLRQEELRARETGLHLARMWRYLGPLTGIALWIVII